MSTIQRGDMVGLFHEYGPENCLYLGLAEYIGEEDAPDGLAEAGTFDGAHLNMSFGRIVIGPGKQMAFRLLENEEIVYEQEAFYAPQDKIQRLLDNCKGIHDGEIGDLRALESKKHERHKELPLVAEGFIEVHISFKNASIPSDIDDFDADDYLNKSIVDALETVGFAANEIDVEVRSVTTSRKED